MRASKSMQSLSKLKLQSSTNLLVILNTHNLNQLIFSELALSDIGRLAQLNQEYHDLITHGKGRSALIGKSWSLLMYYLIKADWDRAEILIAANPSLIFIRNKININDQLMIISPLQYVVYVVDNYGLELCQKYITDIPSCELYWEQLSMVNARFNFQPFIDHYEGAQTASAIGYAQGSLLPMWVLIEHCTHSNWKGQYRWNGSKFNDPRPEGECFVVSYTYYQNKNVNLRYLEKTQYQLGINCFIKRESDIPKQVCDTYGGVDTINMDDDNARLLPCKDKYLDQNHSKTVSIYRELIKVRLERQIILLLKMGQMQKCFLEEISQLYQIIEQLSNHNIDEYDSILDRLFEIPRWKKLHAAQTRIRVLKGEISPYNLSFFNGVLQHNKKFTEEETPSPPTIISEIYKYKTIYSNLNDKEFLSSLIDRALKYRWGYKGLKCQSRNELNYWKRKTFMSNYQFAADIVSCFTERLNAITDLDSTQSFLKLIKKINDWELRESGENDNGDHCLVSLFIAAIPRSFQTKDDLQTVLPLANPLNTFRLTQGQELYWASSFPPKEQPNKICHLFFKSDNKTEPVNHGINLVNNR